MELTLMTTLCVDQKFAHWFVLMASFQYRLNFFLFAFDFRNDGYFAEIARQVG